MKINSPGVEVLFTAPELLEAEELLMLKSVFRLVTLISSLIINLNQDILLLSTYRRAN